VTLPEGNSYEFVYTFKNQMVEVTRNPKPGSMLSSTTVNLTYNESWNRVEEVQDSISVTASFEFDAESGLPTRIVFAEVDEEAAEYNYTYDDKGRIQTITDPLSIMSQFDYDEVTDDPPHTYLGQRCLRTKS